MEMKNLFSRTLLLLSLSAMGGIYLATGENILFCGFLLSAGFFLSFWHGNRKKNIAMVLAVLIFFLGASWRQGYMDGFLAEENGTSTKIEGRVTDIVREEETRTVIHVKLPGLFQPKVRMVVYCGLFSPMIGDWIVARGTLAKPGARTNPGGFDEKKFLYSRNTAAVLHVHPGNYALSPGSGITRAAGNVYHHVKDMCTDMLGLERGNLLSGMLIGSREGIEPEVSEAFQKSGLSHTMAVSGSHVAYLLLPLLAFFSLFGLERKRYYWMLFLILGFYMFLTGLSPSVVRAGIMAGCFLLSDLLLEERDSWTSLGMSALVLMAGNPFCIYDASFILSYSCVASLLLFHGPLVDWMGCKGPAGKALAMTLAVQLGATAAGGKLFHTLNLYSVFANISVFFIRMALSVLSMLMVALGSIIPFMGQLLSWPVGVLLDAVELTARVFSSLPMASVSLHYMPPSFLLLYVSGLALLLPGRDWKKALSAFALAAGVLAWSLAATNSHKAVFFDVGQADASLVKAGGGKDILIDTGKYAPLASISYFSGQVIDAVFITHSHEDHLGGLEQVLRRFTVKTVYLPDIRDGALDKAEEMCVREGVPVQRVRAGDSFLVGKTRIQVLHPDEYEVQCFNHASLVLKLSYNGYDILYTGDIEDAGERDLLELGEPLGAHVLKVAHHGSDTSSSQVFLGKVNPAVGVISTGTNRYGHPSPETIGRLEDQGTAVFRTDTHGCVTVTFHREGIRVKKGAR
ncbi:MAG: DNA internalization-related competence protein ComEC/Rec2 [Clostridia bacterium]